MSGIYYNGTIEQPGLPVVQTLTGNSGGVVGADGLDNINIVGSGGVIVTGNPGTNTLTITDAGSLRSTTYVDGTPYTVLLTDDVILVDTADVAAPINIILPDSPPNDGQVWTIKDWSGASATYPVTINTVSSLSILDGQSTYVLANNYESASFVWSSSLTTYSITAEVLPSIIVLPTTTPSTGFIEIGGSSVMQAYGSNNMFIGPDGGNFSLTGTDNSSLGHLTLASLTSGSYNLAAGGYAMQLLQDGTVNVGLGYQCLAALVSGSSNAIVGENGYLALVDGSYNLGMGQFCGANYTGTESSNIMFNHGGVLGESNTLRIGAGTGSGAQQLAATYIAGIDGVDLTSTSIVTNSGDQLGQATLTPGAGISITTGVNEIIIATDLTAPSTTFINSSPYTVLTTDYVILVDTVTIAAPSTVMLIDAPTIDGQEWTIKDATGSAGAGNTITLQSVSGLINIDGATTYVINSAYESVTVVWSASQSQYYII